MSSPAGRGSRAAAGRLSRRSLLRATAAGAAGVGGLALAGCSESGDSRPPGTDRRTTTTPNDGTVRTVTPGWSELVHRSFGVCAHPSFQQSVYRYNDEWVAGLVDMGAHYFRGLYADHLPLVDATVESARRHGLKWGMLVCNDVEYPPALLERRIADIARRAADVCLFIEGVNEPNYVRGGGSPPSDWAERAVALQQTLYDAVRSHRELDEVTVVGPSLQAVVATDEDYDRLAELGLGELMDSAGMHSYPGGRYPEAGLDARSAPLRRNFPDRGVWLTETGYTNALSTSQGSQPAPEDVVAAYAPMAILEAWDRGMPIVWYEALDDPDPGAKEDAESNYGLFAVGADGAPPWRAKPVVQTLSDFLSQLRDGGSGRGAGSGAATDYQPPDIELGVRSDAVDLRWTALGRRDGSTWLHLRRALDRWDPVAQSLLAVPEVEVELVTTAGRRTVVVGDQVTSVRL